jgi:hypothetical protein
VCSSLFTPVRPAFLIAFVFFPIIYVTRTAPSRFPSVTLSTYVVTDRTIFGFDVGSTGGNIASLVLLILCILGLGLSMAYCISRGDQKTAHIVRAKKSRRQKFEEYWGDVDDSAHSTAALNYGGSMHDEESQHCCKWIGRVPHENAEPRPPGW